MKKTYKFLMAAVIAVALIIPVLAVPAYAQDSNTTFGLNYVSGNGTSGNGIALKATDPRTIAASIINVALTLLGIIAVVIVLVGGFKWMTAGGNEENVESAQKILISGVIGLVIVLAAWGIASFVLSTLFAATGNS